jgi:hypothetical protein
MADNISGGDVVPVLKNTSKADQINNHNGRKSRLLTLV